MSSLAHWIDLAGETYSCEQALTRMRTRTPSLHQEIQNLSGGNQQKVFIARALHVHPKILILDEPTRGIDVGAKYEIYEIIFTLAQSGKAILLVSSDLPELMAMSDRIAVMAHGQLRGILPRAQVNQDAVMKLAIGSDLS
jgi:ABC-type sugar transport system ATPase subunit